MDQNICVSAVTDLDCISVTVLKKKYVARKKKARERSEETEIES